ncbi:MAG: hypothetical protein IT377_01345 [Polyangiaceae bacterium]|nr:hypothetical protein [Polyangiaceae bacterium]
MTERERLSTTLGILLAGLLQAEEAEAESERRPRVRCESGVYRVGEDGLGPEDPPFEPGETRV